MLDVAFFEDEWRILLHAALLLDFLACHVCFYLDFLGGHDLFAFDLHVHGYSVTGLLRDNVIELAREILAWEGEVLGKYDLSKDVFTVFLLKLGLI